MVRRRLIVRRSDILDWLLIFLSELSMINTSVRACWKATHPVILLWVLTLSLPFNHSIVVTGIWFHLFFGLFDSLILKLAIRWTKSMWRLLILHFLFLYLIIVLDSIKRVKRRWHRAIGSWVRFLQPSLSISLTLLFMLINPKFMVGSISLDMINFIMGIIASWAWDCCGKVFWILIKKSLASSFLVFAMRLSSLRAIGLILAHSRALKSFSDRLNLFEIRIFPQFEVNFMFRTVFLIFGLVKLAEEVISTLK